MTYISSFSGPQIDSAIRAVRSGLIDASIFRARIGELTANIDGSVSQISVTPIIIDLMGGDPLLIINTSGDAYNFEVDLGEGAILEKDSTLIPIRASGGGAIEITALEGDPLYLEGSILFERFDNINELIELQNVSISNLGNSILLNNSVGTVGRLSAGSQGAISSLPVDSLLVNLSDGDVLTLLDFSEFELVFGTVDGSVPAGSTNIPLQGDIVGNFLQDQPIALEGESFISSIKVDRDNIALVSSSLITKGSIAAIDGPVPSGDSLIPLSNLEADISSGDQLEIWGPGGEKLFSVIAATDLDSGGTPLVVSSPLISEIPAGSYLHFSIAFLSSKIELSPGQIDLIVSEVRDDLQLESFVSITPTSVTVETPVMKNATWDGEVSLGGAITSFALADGAWAIANTAHFEFRQDATNYFRSKGQGFEFRGRVYGTGGVIIDDSGYVDNTIPGSSLMPGSVIANKLALNYRRISTDLTFTGQINPQRVQIDGEFLSIEEGPNLDISAVTGINLDINVGRNFIYFDLFTEDFGITGNSDDVFLNTDRLLLAMAWRGNIDNDEPPTVISGVANNIYGSEVIAAKSISADKIVANTITGSEIAGFSITGDKITAKTKMVIGEGVAGNQGVIILQGEDSEQWRILVGAIKEDIENNALDANFRLNDQGHLFATGATISGTINALWGTLGDMIVTDTLTVEGAIFTEFDDGNFIRGIRIKDGQLITSLNGNDLGHIRTMSAEFRSGTAGTSAKTTISTTAMIVDSNPTLSPENNPNYTGFSIATGIDVRQFAGTLRPTHRNGRIIYNSSTDKFQGSVNGAWVDLH